MFLSRHCYILLIFLAIECQAGKDIMSMLAQAPRPRAESSPALGYSFEPQLLKLSTDEFMSEALDL